MKKMFTLVLLGLFSLSVAYSTSNIEKVTDNKPYKADRFNTTKLNYIPTLAPTANEKSNAIQGYTKIADLGTTPYYYCMSENAFPVAYEPISKTLAFLEVRFATGTPLNGQLLLRTAQNNGSFGTARVMFNKAGKLPLLPSISVVNPNSSNNVTDLTYFVFAPYFNWNGAGYAVENSRFFVQTKSKLDTVDKRAPEANNPDNAYWFDASTNAVSNGNINYGFISAMLSVPEGSQYGWYGFGLYDFSGNEAYTYIPDSWVLNKFKASTAVTSTFNNRMYMDTDNSGNLYSAVTNIFTGGDAEFRTLGISKSTDGGESWSDWEKMPKTVFTDFCNEIQSPDASKCYIYPYAHDAFVATGNDSYTFMCTAIIYSGVGTDGNDDFSIVVTEISKENGSWKMRPISGSSGIFMQMIRDMDNSNTAVRDSIFRSVKDWDYSLSKTADGKHIVAKWLDYTKYVTHAPVTLGAGQKFDSSLVNDVFTSYRLVGDNQWSKPVNQTNDDLYNKFTYIPKIVPDLQHVPMISMQTVHSTQTTHPYEAYPDAIFQRIVDWNNAAFLSTFNVEEGGQTDVVEESNYNFSINSISPNPASEIAEISFTVNNPSNIKLEIYNNMGQLVKVLINGRVNLGTQTINAKFDGITAGTYFLKLSDGANTVTKNLVVIK